MRSWWQRSRSAWGSINRISAMCIIITCRKAWRTTHKKSVGRDGQDSTCEVLASVDDVTVLENFTYGDTPDKTSIGAIIDWVLAKENQFDVSVYDLSRRYDVRPLVIETLLTYPELEDVVEATEPFYNEYQFVLLKSAKEIL